MCVCLGACVRACVCVCMCVRACVCVCVCACVSAGPPVCVCGEGVCVWAGGGRWWGEGRGVKAKGPAPVHPSVGPRG